MFCVITLIAGKGGPEKGRFDFERLRILAPVSSRHLSRYRLIYRDAGSIYLDTLSRLGRGH